MNKPHNTMLNPKDILQIEERGASVAIVKEQINHFKTGFPWMKIVGPATPQRGIKVLDKEEVAKAVDYYKKADINGVFDWLAYSNKNDF